MPTLLRSRTVTAIPAGGGGATTPAPTTGAYPTDRLLDWQPVGAPDNTRFVRRNYIDGGWTPVAGAQAGAATPTTTGSWAPGSAEKAAPGGFLTATAPNGTSAPTARFTLPAPLNLTGKAMRMQYRVVSGDRNGFADFQVTLTDTTGTSASYRYNSSSGGYDGQRPAGCWGYTTGMGSRVWGGVDLTRVASIKVSCGGSSTYDFITDIRGFDIATEPNRKTQVVIWSDDTNGQDFGTILPMMQGYDTSPNNTDGAKWRPTSACCAAGFQGRNGYPNGYGYNGQYTVSRLDSMIAAGCQLGSHAYGGTEHNDSDGRRWQDEPLLSQQMANEVNQLSNTVADGTLHWESMASPGGGGAFGPGAAVNNALAPYFSTTRFNLAQGKRVDTQPPSWPEWMFAVLLSYSSDATAQAANVQAGIDYIQKGVDQGPSIVQLVNHNEGSTVRGILDWCDTHRDLVEVVTIAQALAPWRKPIPAEYVTG